ncbi:prepilin-type N-terminal cleavage/methylation domain-containing protein [Heyndrickxia ginsengihumi]|uniref:prepilin-type N-terminal cleavage/methylation domain-containing protein n=1 Tax=Heyndrickxia ginsengihumi TaxID=363870 RepID=UPI001D89E36D|nr:prepilin-type N-terminal cleavage/methylation domain-containing protein [Bacillus sp. (in: firmicutes)]
MLRKKRKLLKSEKGFTLIELLAVIVILAIIAAIAIPAIGSIIKGSKVNAVKADATEVLNAAKLYVAANGVPSDGTLDKSDLASYIDDDTIKLDDGYSVTVTENSGKVTYKLDADSNSDSGVTLKFSGATLNDINDAGKEDNVTIGSGSGS